MNMEDNMSNHIRLCVDIPEEVYYNMVIKNEYTERDVIAVHNALMGAMFFQSYFSDHEKIFEKIIVEYPPEETCIYPEYKGKPYFSIEYIENGQHIIGFGSYNPEVLSRYLTEYFILPVITKESKSNSIKMVTNAKEAEEYEIISEDISKGFKKFTEMMYKQGEE